MLIDPRYKNATKLILIAVCVLSIGFLPNWSKPIKSLNKLQVLGVQHTVSQTSSDVSAAPELISSMEAPSLTAKSVLAYDFQSGSILFTKDFDERLPVASLTKLVSALVVLESGKLNEDVIVQEQDIRVVGANTGLVVNERIPAKDLLKAMLISSHNDSTRALARHVGGSQEGFVILMNKKAHDLGMRNTNFTNAVGFDNPNHYSTAQDLTLVLREFLKHESLRDIVKTKEAELVPLNVAYTHKIKTTNKLLLEDGSVVGVKTGYTTEAKGNLVIRSIRDNADIVTIVLGSDDREGDTRKILDWVHTVYKW